jgi:transposase
MAFQPLSDEQWERISFFVPEQEMGRPRTRDREILDAILYVLSTDCRWCELPERFPPKSTVHKRFQEWAKARFFEKALRELSKDLPASETYHLDSSLKAAKKGETRSAEPALSKAAR